MPARLTELEEKIYIAIRTAPKHLLTDIQHIDTGKHDDATAELSRLVVDVVQDWVADHDLLDLKGLSAHKMGKVDTKTHE